MRKIFTIIITLLFLSLVGCNNQEKSPQSGENVSTPKLDLHGAIYMKDLKAIRQHIIAGSDVNVLEPSRKSTPLITAAALGEQEAAKILIDAGADINYKNNDGSTALQTAIVFGKIGVAKLLIKAGSNVNDKNNDGSTPLHTAAFFCRTEIIETLLDKNADKTLKNHTGKTAFDIVKVPFENVKEIYDAIGAGLKPIGIELDYDRIKSTRPKIAELLK